MTNDRYAGKPLLILLENYVLSATGNLPPENSARVAVLVQRVFGGGEDWRATLRQQLQLDERMDQALSQLWERNVAASNGETALSPADFARRFVDANFVRLLDEPSDRYRQLLDEEASRDRISEGRPESVASPKEAGMHVDLDAAELLERYAAGERRFVDVWLAEGSDLRGAALDGISLEDSGLSDVDVRDANLRGATFRRCNLKCTDFRGADLTGARFEEVSIEGAAFAGAVTEGCTFVRLHAHTATYDGLPPDQDG